MKTEIVVARYNENLDLSGGIDFNSLVTINDGQVSVDSVSEGDLNKTATIEMYNLDYEFVPIIFKDGILDNIVDSNPGNKWRDHKLSMSWRWGGLENVNLNMKELLMN